MMRIPRWLKIILVLVAVLVVIGLALPYFLDVDRYRDTIAASIQAETGRNVSIGKIRARFLPRVGFTLENVSLGNPQGFPEGNLLSIEEIRGGLAVGPLLSKEIQITSVELVRPKLMLLTDERGRVNYDLSPPKKSGKAAPATSTFHLAAIPEITLTDVELIVGTARRSKGGIVQTVRATNLNAVVGNVVLDAKALKQWTADADLSGLNVEVAGLSAAAEFKSGEVKLRNGAIDSKFEGDLGKVAHAKGTLAVEDINKGLVKFTLSTALLDLDKLVAAAQSGSTSPSAPVAGSELLAQGRISADKVRYAPYEATNAKADVKIYTDRIEFVPLTAALYAGSLNLSGRLNTNQTPSHFSANIKLQNIDVAKLLDSSSSTSGSMTGLGELALRVAGPMGGSMLDSLTGTGDLAVRNGSFPKFNLGALNTLNKVGQFLSGGGGSGSSVTTFTYFGGDLNIAAGRVMSNRVHMDSNLGAMDLRGSFGFDQTLDYDGQAQLTGGATGGSGATNILTGILGAATKTQVTGLSIPFAVRGTFDKPKIVPGKGIPGLKTSAPSQGTQTQPQEQKKKSIFDIFKKP